MWITPGEIEKLGEFLGLGADDVRRRYLRRVGGRISLVEDPKSKDCIFLRRDAEGRSNCAIYQVRPTQCRTWPFWPTNLYSPDAWNLAGGRCPGINRGPLHPFDEIEDSRKRTRP